MGSSNANASFRGVISGRLNSAGANEEQFDFGDLDALTVGLGTNLVRTPTLDQRCVFHTLHCPSDISLG